jgi:hypothetical protein
MTPEGRVKKKVNTALKVFGADCYRFMPVQSGLGAKTLDYLLAIRGRFVAIETKAPGNKLTPLQEGTKAAIEAAGGLVFVVWDETSLELAMKILLALEYDKNGLTDSTDAFDGIDAYLNAATAQTEGKDQQYLCKRLSRKAPY